MVCADLKITIETFKIRHRHKELFERFKELEKNGQFKGLVYSQDYDSDSETYFDLYLDNKLEELVKLLKKTIEPNYVFHKNFDPDDHLLNRNIMTNEIIYPEHSRLTKKVFDVALIKINKFPKYNFKDEKIVVKYDNYESEEIIISDETKTIYLITFKKYVRVYVPSINTMFS